MKHFLLIILSMAFGLTVGMHIKAQNQSASQSRISFRGGDHPGTLSISNRLVLDEALIDGRFVIRYWNPNGQIWPEMHFSNLKWAAYEPAESFRLC
ncbi:MAG: hypothetical protein PHG06_14890, partial [Parabacteroides sp.]|nr:hypothetical protein [Parabacteroides sp.]